MSRRISSNVAQLRLVPSDLGFWLPEDHQARFFDEVIESELNLFSILRKYNSSEKRGRPRYDPVMLTKIMVYAYSVGLNSTREIEQACIERIDFRFLSGNRQPDHRTIAAFRKQHLKELGDLFEQVLVIAVGDSLVELKDVAIDGTKVLANASKHKAMSYDHMIAKSKHLRKELTALRKERRTAPGKRRKQLDIDIKFKRERLEKIRKSKSALEDRVREESGEKPNAKEQRNFTDPESRIMKVGGDFEQCYNAQAAVDKKHQIILAVCVSQNANDKKLLEPVVQLVANTLGIMPDRVLADAGYFSEAVVQSLKARFTTTQWFIATGRLPHGRNTQAPRGRIPATISITERMKRQLSTKSGKAAYAQRKAIVEPVFGQIKEANLDFRQFSLRGLSNVQHEWRLVCAVHNLLKIFRSRKTSAIKQTARAA